MSVAQRIGIDFGTTNSALACVRPGEAPRLVTYEPSARRGPTSGGPTGRSVIFFHPERRDARQRLIPWAGPAALDAYLEALDDEVPGRLMQSLKSHLASKSFSRTQVFGTSYDLPDLVAVIVSELVRLAAAQLGTPVREAVVGRPVRFAAAETPEDDALAETRLRAAFARAGVDSVTFEHEPVAAAHFYDAALDHDELVLIADFGGGTSDFTVMRLGQRAFSRDDVLAIGGVAVAGDAFDAGIMRSRVAKHFGAEVTYKVPFGSNILGMPVPIIEQLCSPAHLSILRRPDIAEFLRSVRSWSLGESDKDALDQLQTLVDDALGFQLFEVIENAKRRLSSEDVATIDFEYPSIDVHERITRPEFEGAAEKAKGAILSCLDETVTRSGVGASGIDVVCCTGGTARVPLLADALSARFGADKIQSFRGFHAVVEGLARQAHALASSA